MVRNIALVALLAAVAEAGAPMGFSFGANKADGSFYSQQEYEALFKQAASLPNAQGFNSARLYTMQQGNNIISAIPAAISTNTRLLLGMWASGTADYTTDAYSAEKAAFKKVLDQYGDKLKTLVDGISVGNEDIYRVTPLGKSNPNPGAGQNGTGIADFINQTKDMLKGTALEGVPVGHVDTWSAWVDPLAADAITAADFLGVDAYPYWQNTVPNGIENGKSLFNEAMNNVKNVAKGKDLWITETGWPVKGNDFGAAKAGTDNAKQYWQDVGCANFGSTPTWWYTLEEQPTSGNPDFSIFDASSGKPYFDLSCSGVSSNSTSTGSSTASGTGSASTGMSTGTGSGASNGTYTTGSPAQPSSTSSGSGSSGSGSGSTGSGSGSGSSGSGSSGSGSGSAGSGASGSGSANAPVATGGASSFGAYSLGSLMALAATVVALL